MSNPFTKLKSKGSTINEILDAPLTININLDDIEVRLNLRAAFDVADHSRQSHRQIGRDRLRTISSHRRSPPASGRPTAWPIPVGTQRQ